LPFAVSPFEKPEYLSKAEKVLLIQQISDGQNALNKNRYKLKFKTSLYQSALILLIISSLLLIAKDVNIWPTTIQIHLSSHRYSHHRLLLPPAPQPQQQPSAPIVWPQPNEGLPSKKVGRYSSAH